MKRPSSTSTAAPSAIERIERPKSFPRLDTLVDVLCQPCWEDLDAKGESALFLFRSAHQWRAILKVETPPLCLTVPGRSIDELLATLEKILQGDDVPWVQDPNPLGRRDVKKKRGA